MVEEDMALNFSTDNKLPIHITQIFPKLGSNVNSTEPEKREELVLHVK